MKEDFGGEFTTNGFHISATDSLSKESWQFAPEELNDIQVCRRDSKEFFLKRLGRSRPKEGPRSVGLGSGGAWVKARESRVDSEEPGLSQGSRDTLSLFSTAGM